jgi:outer membrane protein
MTRMLASALLLSSTLMAAAQNAPTIIGGSQPAPSLAGAAQGTPPAPRVVLIDRSAIMQYSKVGQDIAKQVQAYAAQAKNDLAAQSKALQEEGRTLQQQVAILAPDIKAKRLAAFQAREASLQTSAQKKEEQIKAGVLQARQAMEQKLGPILQQLVKERGANMVLDKQAVVYATVAGFDITNEAITRLNQQMPSYKVSLNAPRPAAAKKP